MRPDPRDDGIDVGEADGEKYDERTVRQKGTRERVVLKRRSSLGGLLLIAHVSSLSGDSNRLCRRSMTSLLAIPYALWRFTRRRWLSLESRGTGRFKRQLWAWMDDDPYAFCYEIEKDVCQAFGKAELAAFEALICVRYEGAPTPLDFDGRRWSQTLRRIYLAQQNVTAYKKLAEETGFMA